MSYQVLARKWRPKSFSQLVGQEAVVQALVNGLDNDRVHHAFLFTGTRGVGKTTLARILAKCLNCEAGVSSTPCGECGACVDIDEGRFHDMLEIDAASRTKVDDTRELLETVQFAPARGRFKVYIIDEVHMLSAASFNALLKTLEEPPPHVKFVLATTDPEKIPVTILSRCLRFNLRRLLPNQISGYLESILEDEGIEAEQAAVERISRGADGSMRDALSLLDQAIAFGGGSLKDEQVAQMMGSVDHEHVARLIEAVAAGDADSLLGIVGELSAQARNLESVLQDMAEVLHRAGLVQLAPDYRDPERADWASVAALAERLSPEDVQLYYQIAIQGRRDLGLAPDPRTGLEMTLLRMLAFRPQPAGEATGSGGGAARSGNKRKTAPPERETRTPAVAASTEVEQGTHAGQRELLDSLAPTHPQAAIRGDEDWHQLLTRLQLSGPVRELARNIQLESRQGGKWHFLIPDTARSLASEPMVQKLRTALSAQLGQEVDLDLHTAKEPVSTPAVVSEQASVRRMSEAERAIEEDPTVLELRKQLGARIVEDSIQPLQ